MGNAIIWVGPVSTSNLKDVQLPADWHIYTISKELVAPGESGGLVPQQFRNFYASLPGDKLGAILSRAGADKAIIASFSAGHGLLEELLKDYANDSRILGVLSSDSYYGLPIKPGYKAFADRAVADGTPFILTTSNSKDGTITKHSGSESVSPFSEVLGLVPANVPEGMPAPERAVGNNRVLWLDYQGQFAHPEHASKLAPLALNWMLKPGSPAPPSPGYEPDLPGPMPLFVFMVGMLTGYMGYKFASKA